MSTPLVKVFSIGAELPDIQILSSASRSKWPHGLHGEVRDAPVRDGVVLHLLAREPLLVDEHQPAIGEQDRVPDQQIGGVHLLAMPQQSRVVPLRRCRVDAVRVSEQSHESPRFLVRTIFRTVPRAGRNPRPPPEPSHPRLLPGYPLPTKEETGRVRAYDEGPQDFSWGLRPAVHSAGFEPATFRSVARSRSATQCHYGYCRAYQQRGHCELHDHITGTCVRASDQYGRHVSRAAESPRVGSSAKALRSQA